MPDQNKIISDPLVEKCLNGDRRAQYIIYKKYSKAMYNLAYRMVNNREDAEDILQEAFAQAFKSIASFRYDSTFGAWLKRIIINKSINYTRSRKKTLFIEDGLDNEASLTQTEEDEVVYSTGKVFKAIEMLPDGYRMVLTLYLLEGYDHEEISEILGIAESTSKSQYMRAKAKLRLILSDR